MKLPVKIPVKKEEKAKKQRGKASAAVKRDRMGSAVFLSPSLIGVLVFFLLPFIVVIYYALVDNPISHNFVFVKNFVSVFNNSAFRQAAANTLKFSFISVPLAVVLSLVLAVMLENKIPFRSQFRTFFLSPMMVPVASIVLIWQVLFDYNGAINEVMKTFGATSIDWFKSGYSLVVVVLLFLWKNLGYNMILFMAALANIPQDVLEVTRLDTSSSVQIFFRIKLRYLSSTVLFVTIFSLINSFKIFREVYLLTGNHPYDTLYMLQHFMNNMFKSLDYQKLSAAAIIMAVVVVALIGILFIAEDRYGKDVEG